jgi:hypothetical protein
MVVTIIGVLAAMIVPQFAGSHRSEVLRAAARELVDVIGLAHSDAVATGRTHELGIDPASGRWVLEAASEGLRWEPGGPMPFESSRRSPPAAVRSGRLDPSLRIELREPALSRGERRGPSPQPGAAHGALVFRPDGTSETTEVVVGDREGGALVLRIDPITSRVEVVDLEREERR